jgi:hypothetical protein
MSAIITDQFRILNASNFVDLLTSTSSSFYSFVGLSNATDYDSNWDDNPPSPKDNFDEENDYWDTIIALKKISNDDVRQVIRKITWSTGTTYDMYRHDISRFNLAKPSNATSLYSSNFYVMNSEYRVYICLQNGSDPENPNGRQSLDEPQFVDLEPGSAGTSGDGYIWKYLYTINPSDIIKFDSINFIPVPRNWKTSTNSSIVSVRENASTSGQIKVITIKNRGIGIGTANQIYTNVPIKGDGFGASATIVIGNDSKVESVIVSDGGSGYTHGRLDLSAAGVPQATVNPIFDVIIPPQGGHGADIYRELGATNVLVYSRIENDIENPDFITGNQIARIGLIENPLSYGTSSTITLDKASAVSAIKLVGAGYSFASFNQDSRITQTIGVGITAVGRVISYSKETGILKYWQDRSLVGFNTDKTQNNFPEYGYNLNKFTSDISAGGELIIKGGSTNLNIDSAFTGVSTTINSRTYNLGQQFNNGISNPEVQKYSGKIIYVDNRPSITRSINQKEDIKVILQF